jgi:hypothetical protein
MPGTFSTGQKILLGAWGVAFVLLFTLLGCTDGHPPRTFDQTKQLKDLKLYARPDGTYAEEPRQKAIDFSLDRIAAVVNYLLLAAAGVLAFAVKTVVELRAERVKNSTEAKDGAAKSPPILPPRRAQLLLFLHAGFACFFSLVCGVLAYMYLGELATSESFNLGGHLSVCMAFQALALLGALLLLLTALFGFVRDLLPSEKAP